MVIAGGRSFRSSTEKNALRFLLQRVTHGRVEVDAEVVGAIGPGLVVLVGIGQGDDERIADRLIEKLLNLRIFADADGKMNLSVIDVGGGVLLISQFTLYADCRKGRRPAFTAAAAPADAARLYQYCLQRLGHAGVTTASGIFAADMQVSLANDGPVTILLDSADLTN